MNDLKVFSNTEFGELGVMLIDGKEYFPATQCAKILGYVKPADAVRMHCKGVFKMQTPTNGGTVQGRKIIMQYRDQRQESSQIYDPNIITPGRSTD